MQIRWPREHKVWCMLGTQEPEVVDLLFSLLVAQAEAFPEITQEVRVGVGLQPRTPGLIEHPMCARFTVPTVCWAEAPGSSSPVCPCVSVCRGPCACFIFRGKQNKPKANTVCISTYPRAVETSNSLGQEGFPVGLNAHVQRLPAAEGWERAESATERGVRGPREDSPAMDPHPPSFETDTHPTVLSGLKSRPP